MERYFRVKLFCVIHQLSNIIINFGKPACTHFFYESICFLNKTILRNKSGDFLNKCI